MVAARRCRLAAISSFSCGSMIGILPAFRASTRTLLTSRPITLKPRLASTAARGAPSLPRPTTLTRGRDWEAIYNPLFCLTGGPVLILSGDAAGNWRLAPYRRRGDKSPALSRGLMKVEFSAFPRAFSGNVAVFVAADKQLLATAQTLDKASGGAIARALSARAVHRRQGPGPDHAGPVRHRCTPAAAGRRRGRASSMRAAPRSWAG